MEADGMDDLYQLMDGEATPYAVLVSGLENWIDAGLGSAGALATIADLQTGLGGLVEVAKFDVDRLVDHQARRPTMRLVDGVIASLVWPSIDLQSAHDASGEPFLLLRGAEPDHLWQAFTGSMVELLRRHEVRLVVGLGSYPAPAPHTRPPRVVATASNQAMANKVGFLPGQLDVPAGISAAIERACADADIDAVGLWAQVPHYVANFPYPAASAALLEKLAQLTGLEFPTDDLLIAAAETRARIDQLVAQNPEHLAMVQQLEQLMDEQLTTGPLPSADDLAAELEQFLRNQGN
jgi:hypothetical protein